MDHVLQGLDFATVYTDDILVATSSPEEHRTHIRQLLARLWNNGIKAHPAKCIFGVPALDFLQHQATAQGIRPIPQKVDAIRQFPQPTSQRKLQEFLSEGNYYHRFLPKVADTLHPLHDILKGFSHKPRVPLTRMQEVVSSFSAIKDKLAQLPLLTYPDPDGQVFLSMDASPTAVGTALQQTIHGEEVPLGFFSQCLTPAQLKYSTSDKELLAMYLAVQHFTHFLEGHHFSIVTDHKPLTFAMTHPMDAYTPQLQSQLLYISEFATDI